MNEELQGLQEKFMNSIQNAIKLDEINKKTDVIIPLYNWYIYIFLMMN